MAFPSDGRNHKQAVADELGIEILKPALEKQYGRPIKFIWHQGGPGTKVDFMLFFYLQDGENLPLVRRISLKDKTQARTGSFDLANITDPSLQSCFPIAYKVYKEYKGSGNMEAIPLLEDAIKKEIDIYPVQQLTSRFIEKVLNPYFGVENLIVDKEKNEAQIVDLNIIFEFVRSGGRLELIPAVQERAP